MTLYEWNEMVQIMIDWIEQNLGENSVLLQMSAQIGYSPYYCSSQFHKICGMTMKSYIAGRRLAKAALALRDTNARILDIAIEHGFSSQEALTRAFTATFGCTPASYRKNPIPIPLSLYKTIYFPNHYHELHKGEVGMSKFDLREATIRIEYIPAHKYIGVWDEIARNYCEFWEKHPCDEICGIIESMRNEAHPIVSCHTAGWQQKEGKRCYFYGFGVSEDYSGAIPNGFEMREIPASYYMVFGHPPFDYLKDNNEVMKRVEELAWNYDLEHKGITDKNLDYYDNRKLYEWNEIDCPCYQRHYPEVLGYEILRPIKQKN